MREFLDDAHAHRDDGYGRAQAHVKRDLPKRFYKVAAVQPVGDGFAVGLDGRVPKTPGMKQVVVLQGAQNSLASLRVGTTDEVGNTPMELSVTGLPAREHGYYELFVWRHGKPGYPCTGFRMVGDKTTVHFTVPYELKPGTELVVTEVERGKNDWPGRVVMRSV